MATPYSYYPIPRTGVGFHDSSDVGALPGNPDAWAQAMAAEGVTVYKLLADGTNKVAVAGALMRAGIVPIVRLYGEKPHPRLVVHPGWVRPYVDAGARLFEWGNEPNIGSPEWENGQFPPRSEFGRLIGEQWLRNAAAIRAEGGIPMFVAMTPGGYHDHRIAYRQILEYLRGVGKLGTIEQAALAIHPRPHTVPPHVPPSDALTVAFKEYEWIAALFREYIGWIPPMYATEHGYSPGDSTNTGYPPIDEAKAAEYNRILFEMMNPAHPDKCPPYLLGLCYWLEMGGGVWVRDEAFRQRFPGAPTVWGQTFLGMSIGWDRRAYVTGNTQPPPPPPDVPPPPPADDIRLPAWCSVTRAIVPAGGRYWHLKRAYWHDSDQSGGKHHIYALEPHDATVRMKVSWDGRSEYAPLDKPANEPAGNFAIYGAVYAAQLEGRGVTLSDKVDGMKLPMRQHVAYYLEWEERTKGGEVPPPPGGFMIDRRYRSPNHEARPAGMLVNTVVLHHTGGDFGPSLNWLMNPSSGVSTHYLIDRDGSIYELVDEGRESWHAGYSLHKGRENVNDFSIGIELVNDGDGADPYPQRLQDALVWLLNDIKARRGVIRSDVVTHKAIRDAWKLKYPNTPNVGIKTDPRGLNVEAILDRVYPAPPPPPPPAPEWTQRHAAISTWYVEQLARALRGDADAVHNLIGAIHAEPKDAGLHNVLRAVALPPLYEERD